MLLGLKYLGIGLVSLHLSRVMYRLLPYFRSTSSANSLFTSKYPPSDSKYVLIQGATDGIGKQLALHFDRLGYNLILHGRNQNKLQEMQRTLPKAKILKCDLRETNQPIINALAQYDVNILINSAGVTRLDTFNNHSKEDIETLLQVNIVNPTQIIHSFSEPNSTPPSEKLYINICSMTGMGTFPYLSLYGATKTYQNQLLQNIVQENRDFVDNRFKVLNVLPWYITTKMTAFRQSWDSDTPTSLAEGIIKLAVSNKHQGTGTIKHQLISLHLPLLLPYFIHQLKLDYSKLLAIRNRRRR